MRSQRGRTTRARGRRAPFAAVVALAMVWGVARGRGQHHRAPARAGGGSAASEGAAIKRTVVAAGVVGAAHFVLRRLERLDPTDLAHARLDLVEGLTSAHIALVREAAVPARLLPHHDRRAPQAQLVVIRSFTGGHRAKSPTGTTDSLGSRNAPREPHTDATHRSARPRQPRESRLISSWRLPTGLALAGMLHAANSHLSPNDDDSSRVEMKSTRVD